MTVKSGSFLPLILAPMISVATTYYVDAVNGEDGNDGTSAEQAKLSVEAGIACLKAKNDQLVLAAGTYAVTNDMTVLPAYDGLVIRGADPDRTKTVLTGSGQYRGFQTSHNQHFRNLTFSNFYNTVKSKTTAASIHFATWHDCTVSNCWFYANTNNCASGTECGGILQCSSRPPKCQDCLFELNATPNARGGAICHMGGVNTVWTLTNCTFRGNFAMYGGAVYCNKSMSIKANSCRFEGNRCSNTGGALDGAGTWTDCVFTNNLSMGIAGAAFPTAGITFRRCTFTDNTATNNAGAFCNGNIRDSWFYDCSFTGNHSVTASGGAIFAIATGCGAPGNWVNLVSNCTFTANSATNGSGGAIYGLTLQTKDCRFYYNRAKTNGGAFSLGDAYPMTAHTLFHCVSNCTFRGNEIVRSTAGGCGGGLDVNCQTNFMVGGCTFLCNAITNSSAGSGNGAYCAGGALYSQQPIYLHDCQFVSNAAIHAGGAFFGNATGGVMRCTFIGNRTDYDAPTAYVPGAGSAIAFERGTTDLADRAENCWWNFLEDCVFSNNFCRGTGTTIYSTRGGLRMKRCDFIGNVGRMDSNKPWYMLTCGVIAYRGEKSSYCHYSGAANGKDYPEYAGNRSIFQFDDCRFIGNESAGLGGDICAYYLSTFDSRHPKSHIRNCLFADTTLATANLGQTYAGNGMGGAILLGKTSEVKVENCTFVNNTAEAEGGAIADLGVSNRVVNCVFHGNTDGAAGRMTDNLSLTDATTVSYAFAPDDGVLENGVNGCIVKDQNPFRFDDHCDLAVRRNCGQGAGLVLDWMNASTLDLGGKPRLSGNSVDFGCYQHYFISGFKLIVR